MKGSRVSLERVRHGTRDRRPLAEGGGHPATGTVHDGRVLDHAHRSERSFTVGHRRMIAGRSRGACRRCRGGRPSNGRPRDPFPSAEPARPQTAQS